MQISHQLQRRYQKRIGLKDNLLANPTDKDSAGIQLKKYVHNFPHVAIWSLQNFSGAYQQVIFKRQKKDSIYLNKV